jgi:hypothetical protein
MSIFKKIERIKSQIVDTERMLKLVGSHPIMAGSLKEKLNTLREELSKLPSDSKEAKISLLFSGTAVKGSLGIKSNFVGAAIRPFQELVKTQTSLVRFGNVGKRGQNKKAANSELFLTALPVGSFGIELSQLETNDLFDELDVANAMKQIMDLFYATSVSDESFETAIINTPKRNLNNLKRFLKVLDDEDSILKIETGSFGVEISKENIHLAFERVDKTSDQEDEIIIIGIVRGFLLDSGRFEILNIEGKTISGFISEDLSEDDIIRYDKEFLNKQCKIHLRKSSIKFKTGREKISFELLGVSNI